jgi:hypothetical protein
VKPAAGRSGSIYGSLKWWCTSKTACPAGGPVCAYPNEVTVVSARLGVVRQADGCGIQPPVAGSLSHSSAGPAPFRVGAARLTCWQPSGPPPFAQLRGKREDFSIFRTAIDVSCRPRGRLTRLLGLLGLCQLGNPDYLKWMADETGHPTATLTLFFLSNRSGGDRQRQDWRAPVR